MDLLGVGADCDRFGLYGVRGGGTAGIWVGAEAAPQCRGEVRKAKTDADKTDKEEREEAVRPFETLV
jgi:hypothetical protein